MILYLAIKGIFSEKTIVASLLPILFMFGAVNGFEISWKGSSFSFQGTQNSYAHGLRLNAMHYNHNYKENGDFEGVVVYDVSNKTDIDIMHLLPDSAGWFGRNIQGSLCAEIIGEEQKYYKVKDPRMYRKEETNKAYDGLERELTYFYWYPTLSDGIPPQKRLHYQVRISTKVTEKEIFTAAGTFAGMGSNFNAKKISCELNAPAGYQLTLKSYMVRDQAGREIQKERKRIKPPKLAEDRKQITWFVKNPIPTIHYYLNVCLEKT